jgi:LPS-assembly protein
MNIFDSARRIFLLAAGSCFAMGLLCTPAVVRAEGTTITADSIEYFGDEQKYVASGNVKITKDGAVIDAYEAVYFENTADAELTGHVSINDSAYLINTDHAEFNLEDNTGTMKHAVIFSKKDNVWISGEDMQKLDQKHYHAKTAYFTTCDSEAYRTGKVLATGDIPVSERPDWCFKGEDADIVFGETMTAKNVTYRLKDTPVLYSPYLWTGIGNNRETGLELPAVGFSSRKGFRYSQAFFWAIDENKDATVNMDYYSKRGIGTGAEYRFLDFNHKGTWYVYHIGDSELHKDFFEVKVTDRYNAGNIQAFLDANYINDAAFYKEYPKDFGLSISRFLQTTGEVSVPLNNSRLYLLSQYWVNLREGVTEHVPQKVPELGYVLNPTPVGPAIFTLSASAANFYRDFDPRGQRVDIKPALSYSFGDSIRLTQTVSVRETAYELTNGGTFGSSPHRELFEYDAQAQMRFIKNYDSFMHIFEPSVEYMFIPSAKALPLFDSTELPAKTNLVRLVLFNKFMFDGVDVSLRLSQPYEFDTVTSRASAADLDFYTENAISYTTATSDHLQPVKLEGAVSGTAFPVNLTFDAAYDIKDGRLDNLNSAVNFKVFRDISLGLGERYSRIDDIMLYTLGFNAPLGKHWIMNFSSSYDAKGPGLRDFMIKTSYKEQCWNVDLVASRRPADQLRPAGYSYYIVLDLKGLGSFKL